MTFSFVFDDKMFGTDVMCFCPDTTYEVDWALKVSYLHTSSAVHHLCSGGGQLVLSKGGTKAVITHFGGAFIVTSLALQANKFHQTELEFSEAFFYESSLFLHKQPLDLSG